MWYVIALIWVALLAGIIWAYNGKQRKRGAERAKEFAALLSELKGKPNPAAIVADNTAAPAAATTQVPDATTQVPELSRKQRLLPPAEALLYYVFRTGLPDHEIFAGLTLADVIDVAPALRGYER